MIKFTLAKEHRQYFEKHQLLELEEILTFEQVLELKKQIERTVSQVACNHEQWRNLLKGDKQLMAGHDLWRHDALVKKIVTNRELAKIAADLVQAKFLRIGYDQLIPGAIDEDNAKAISLTSPKPSIHEALLKKEASLVELSALQGLLCGMMICLKSTADEEEAKESNVSPFANRIGNIVFFAADKKIDFSLLNKHRGQHYLLVAYAEKTSLYIPNENDPHQHALKQLGYVFGDRLTDTLNPVVFRT